MQTIIYIAQHGKNENSRLAACNTILDRGWGKARQSHHHVQHDQPITHVEVAGQVDLRRLSDEEIKEFERLLDRATVPPPIEAKPVILDTQNSDDEYK